MDSSNIVNRLDFADVGLIKFGVLLFAFWLVSASASIANWVIATNHWLFLMGGIICMIKPLYDLYLKKDNKVNNKTEKIISRKKKRK